MRAKRYLLLYKHIILNKSFLILLVSLPLILFALTFLGEDSKGLINIGVNEEFDSVLPSQDLINFVALDNNISGKKALEQGIVDSYWELEDDAFELLKTYIADNKLSPIVNVLEKENSLYMRFSRIMLDCIFLKEAAIDIYHDYASDYPAFDNKKDVLDEAFANRRQNANFVELSVGNYSSNTNVMTLPFRGMLAIFLLLMGLLVSLNLNKDYENNLFIWWNTNSVLTRDFMYYAGPMFIGMLLMLVGVFIENSKQGKAVSNLGFELIGAMIYVLSVIALANLCRTIIRSTKIMCIVIPIIILTALVFSPVFIHVRMILWIRLLLPPYYYLMGTSDSVYVLWLAIYTLVLILMQILIEKILLKKLYKKP